MGSLGYMELFSQGPVLEYYNDEGLVLLRVIFSTCMTNNCDHVK